MSEAGLKSMTGFSRHGVEGTAYDVAVEIRTVNHRYLDVRLRGGGSILGPLEPQIRDRVASRLSRGKVELGVHLTPHGESAFTVEIDRPLVEELRARLAALSRETGIAGELTISDVLRFQPAFRVRERELSEEDLWNAVAPALDGALEALDEMRASEGAVLAADMAERMKSLTVHLDAVELRSHERRESRREELRQKVEEILASSVEPPTVAMEVARLVERSDISEEVTRLRSHIALWESTAGSGTPCGKKLDFIVQEMNREVNTIGSKSQDAAIAERVIAMKAELERVREQVQNVE